MNETEPTLQYFKRLREGLVSFFSSSELQTLCFDIGVDYDSLPGEDKEAKARELIAALHRRGRLPELITYCSRVRSNFSWHQTPEAMSIATKYQVTVECSDIVDFICDVVVLKYAQAFYGADKMVASRITDNYGPHYQNIAPLPGEYILLPSKGEITARQVLFVGMSSLYQIDYGAIREFVSRAMQILAQNMPSAKHIAMTIHGVNFGLDETECFLAQIAGLLDAFRNEAVPPFLQRVTVVERNQNRAMRLQQILKEHLPRETLSRQDYRNASLPQSRINAAGLKSSAKPHVFVAMPFSEEMEDTYIFGIQAPVNVSGYLCERVDLTTFTGDILTRIKSRIETASLVIADLTGANPNVYFEVGYAQGKNRPTLLIAKKGDELKFDVQSQRCIIYNNISDLAKKLEADLTSLSNQSNLPR